MDHEEWHVAGGPYGGHPQAPEHRGKLRGPSSVEFVQLVDDSRLEALQDHVVHVLDLPVCAGVRHGGPIDTDVAVITKLEESFHGELRVRDSKAVGDVEEELHGLLRFDHGNRPSLYPLRELVHGDKQSV